MLWGDYNQGMGHTNTTADTGTVTVRLQLEVTHTPGEALPYRYDVTAGEGTDTPTVPVGEPFDNRPELDEYLADTIRYYLTSNGIPEDDQLPIQAEYEQRAQEGLLD